MMALPWMRLVALVAVVIGLGFPLQAWGQPSEDDFAKKLQDAREKLSGAIQRTADAAAKALEQALRESVRNAGQKPPQPTPGAGRGWLGMSALAAPQETLKERSAAYGLLVERVVTGGPASKAGIVAGDLLTALNGQPLRSRDDLRVALRKLNPGDAAEFTVRRATGDAKVKVTVGENPANTPGAPADTEGWIGIHVASETGGLLVVSVLPESPAAKAGVRPGDLIVEIEGKPAATSAVLRDAFRAKKIGETLTLKIKRADQITEFKVPVEKRPAVQYDPRPQPNPGLQLPEFPGRPDPAIMQRLGALNTRGCDLLRQQKYQEAIPFFEQMLEIVPNDDTALYNLACAYALMGQGDKACDYLERSFVAGFTNWEHVKKDTDLDSIRTNPKYVELMASQGRFEQLRAGKKMDQIKEMLTKHAIDTASYIFFIDEERKFIFATNRSRAVMDQVAKDLTTYAEAQWKHLFIRRQKTYIAIVLPSEEDFRKMVPNRMIGGFYNPQAEALLAPALDHTLTHEFTHALHFADTLQISQMHQIWYLEGLATCFENSALKEVTLADGTKDLIPTPMPNERQPAIQEAVAQGQAVPLRAMLRYNQAEFMRQPGLMYAESRHFVMWIWHQGKLAEFHKAYCETWTTDPTGEAALSKVFGKKLEDIEKEYFEWVRNLPPFAGHTGAGGPYLGVGLEEGGEGLIVKQLTENGPAAKAGVKVGDVIQSIDGKRIVSQHSLLEIMANRKPGDIVKVALLREGQAMEIPVTVEARPR